MGSEKAQAVVALAESKLGDPYVYGASGQRCTPEVRRRYAGYHPEYREKIYGACPVLSGTTSSGADAPPSQRGPEAPGKQSGGLLSAEGGRQPGTATGCSGCKWDGHLCYDCRGFTYFLLKECGVIVLAGGGATTQYADAGNWDARGTIADGMPDMVGCLFKEKGGKKSHTGLHAGGGRIIHCSTVVKTGSTGDRSWTHWGIPKGLYSAEEIEEALGKMKREMGKMHGTLRRGSKGDEVRDLQLAMYRLVTDRLEIDGIFGAKTEAAVREFQARNGLAVDGIVGKMTWAAIDEALGRKDGTEEKNEDGATSSGADAPPSPEGKAFGGDGDDAPPSPEGPEAPGEQSGGLFSAEGGREPGTAFGDGAVDDGEITLKNEPVELTYPAGQTVAMSVDVALDLMERMQEALIAGGDTVEIVAPVGLKFVVTAVGAVSVWQQIREVAV